MTAPSDKMRSDTLLRQWAMLRLIPRQPRRISTTDIWGRLKDQGYCVDVRTVQRDLDKLSTIFPLVCDEHKPKGWSWMKEADPFNLPTMDAHTALSYRILRVHAEHLLPRSTIAYLTPYFAMAENILAVQSGSDLDTWTRKVAVIASTLSFLTPEVVPEVIESVYAALLQGRCLVIRYHALQATEIREYLVHPLGLVFRNGAVYLVCTFRDYSDIRHLALHRVQEANLSEHVVKIPPEFDLQQHIYDGRFQYPEGGMIELVLRIHDRVAEHLRETPLAVNQSIRQESDGWSRLEATVQRTKQLRWWLLSFGEYVEVISPGGLREEIATTIRNMENHYA
ncbi:MAG: WYL domain-containing protein [Magnetococcales bacterium]|nr:WYL domain-containing protein [Magnetococcales bacterium]